MALAMTPAAHREKALALLVAADSYPVAPSSGRPVLLAEAQVHATLALSAEAPAPKPARKPKPATKPASEAVPGSEEDLIAQEVSQ
jgi:hypothetical protein